MVKEQAANGAMRTIVEHSPRKESQSVGVVEGAMQPAEGQMRLMRSGLEEVAAHFGV